MSIERCDKVHDRQKTGRYRVYWCAMCRDEVKTFEPYGHKEVIVPAKNKIRLCECGAVALHSKAIQVINPSSPNSRPRKEELYMCDSCLKLEQQPKPQPVKRQHQPVVWRRSYSG